MKLYDKILREAKINTERDYQVLNQLKSSKIFDITNVRHLVGDWDEEKKHLIPKRPPYTIMWAEWDEKKELKEGTIIFRCGTLLMKVSKSLMETWMSTNFSLESKAIFYEKIFGDGWDEWYISQGFVDIKSRGYEKVLGIKVDISVTFYCMKNDSTEAEAFTVAAPEDELNKQVREKRTILGFGLFGLIDEIDNSKITSFVSAEVPLMACSLMHCRNVEIENIRVDEKLQKATIKRGYPKLCECSIIKLKLNEHIINNIRSEKGSRELRMHMVRGHFKNLQGIRIKEKGWHWWPAHVRGNPELGMTDSTYKVEENV